MPLQRVLLRICLGEGEVVYGGAVEGREMACCLVLACNMEMEMEMDCSNKLHVCKSIYASAHL